MCVQFIKWSTKCRGHVNPFMAGGNKTSHILKQTWNEKLQVYLSLYDLLVPRSKKRLIQWCNSLSQQLRF